jgi:hypothetical protein
MKRLFKKLAKSLWRLSEPVRGPVIRKFDRHMMHLIGSVQPRSDPPVDIDLALSGVVRDLARLQIQLEVIQQQIEDLHEIEQGETHLANGLSIVSEMS